MERRRTLLNFTLRPTLSYIPSLNATATPTWPAAAPARGTARSAPSTCRRHRNRTPHTAHWPRVAQDRPIRRLQQPRPMSTSSRKPRSPRPLHRYAAAAAAAFTATLLPPPPPRWLVSRMQRSSCLARGSPGAVADGDVPRRCWERVRLVTQPPRSRNSPTCLPRHRSSRSPRSPQHICRRVNRCPASVGQGKKSEGKGGGEGEREEGGGEKKGGNEPDVGHQRSTPVGEGAAQGSRALRGVTSPPTDETAVQLPPRAGALVAVARLCAAARPRHCNSDRSCDSSSDRAVPCSCGHLHVRVCCVRACQRGPPPPLDTRPRRRGSALRRALWTPGLRTASPAFSAAVINLRRPPPARGHAIHIGARSLFSPQQGTRHLA